MIPIAIRREVIRPADDWAKHFRWNDVEIIPLTPTGRATAALLQFNRPLALAIRTEEKLRHRHPPVKMI